MATFKNRDISPNKQLLFIIRHSLTEIFIWDYGMVKNAAAAPFAFPLSEDVIYSMLMCGSAGGRSCSPGGAGEVWAVLGQTLQGFFCGQTPPGISSLQPLPALLLPSVPSPVHPQCPGLVRKLGFLPWEAAECAANRFNSGKGQLVSPFSGAAVPLPSLRQSLAGAQFLIL